MEVRILEQGDEPRLESFLLSNLASAMFLLSNFRANGLRDDGQRLQGPYAAAFVGARVTGVAAHPRGSDNLLLCAPTHAGDVARAAAAASGRAVAGMLGAPGEIAEACRALGLVLDRDSTQINSQEGLYGLCLSAMVVPPALAAGHVTVRRAEPRDLRVLERWLLDYEVEALGADFSDATQERCRQRAQRLCDGGQTWIAEAAGDPVAFSSFNATVREAVQVGPVWTPPALRGRGYARCAVAASLLEAGRQGVEQAFLFTGDNNVPARRSYAALGFERVGDYQLLLLKSPMALRS